VWQCGGIRYIWFLKENGYTTQSYAYWVIVDTDIKYIESKQLNYIPCNCILKNKLYPSKIYYIYIIFLPNEICFKIVSISSIFITINWPFPSNIDCLSGFRSLSTLTMYSTALPSEEIHRYSLLAISSILFMGKVNLESVKNAVKLAV